MSTLMEKKTTRNLESEPEQRSAVEKPQFLVAQLIAKCQSRWSISGLRNGRPLPKTRA
jgi:hypothetical protein